ncbi:MAG: nucleotidyltransferase family protein [Cetobacterium sp.]|uniref:nucleotidyltransferase family protein n=1 Tax=Cetobacterium sp. TaxID=2071632 RepID=UPI003F41A55E
MLTKIEILNLLKKNKIQIEALGATKIGLFGSYAKDLATDDSDVDILIELALDGVVLSQVFKHNFINHADCF